MSKFRNIASRSTARSRSQLVAGLLLCMSAIPVGSLARAQVAGAQAGAAPEAQAQAQTQSATQQATGTVIGRVVCGDTQRPARFADVTIIPVAEASGNDDDFGGRGRRGSARTDLDGNYTVTNLAPGAYYVTATATGYVATMAAIAAHATANTDLTTLIAQLPQVQVGSGTTTANLSLERGAVIAGRVLWDDGSPASGVQVNAVSGTASGATNPLSGRRLQGGLGGFGVAVTGGFAQTDDRGNFRLTGLAPGEYVVRATFNAPPPAGATGGDPRFGGFNRTVNITLYAPGKMRRADAQTVTLALGEERDDVIFTADLHALHSVMGRVSSASDPAVHSGSVRLVDSQDTTLSRNAQLNADGTFTLPYVPAGTYTLSVPSASSATLPAFGGRRGSSPGSTPVTTFQPLSETLTVTDTDVAGVNLTVVPVTPAAVNSATSSR